MSSMDILSYYKVGWAKGKTKWKLKLVHFLEKQIFTSTKIRLDSLYQIIT